MAKTSALSLRAAREKLDKTQTDIAEELDVTQPAVSGWESAGTAPRPETWNAIAKAYGVPESELTKHFIEIMKAS